MGKKKDINEPCIKCNNTDFNIFNYRDKKGKQRSTRRCNVCQRKLVKETTTRYLRKKYTGFTPEMYEAKLIEQDYSCAICKVHVSETTKALAADHNHETKQARGLLCVRCNVLLGYAKDNTDILAQAILYLEKYKE